MTVMNYNVPPDFQINHQKRSTKKLITGEDLNQALESLNQSIINQLLDEANFWSANLLISGYRDQLWKYLILFYFKHINCINPLLLDYLYQQYLLYTQIKKLYVRNLKNLPNNQELRNHLSELVSLLALTSKLSEEIIIPTEVQNVKIDRDIIRKSHHLTCLLLKNISPQSVLYQQFYGFVVNYHSNHLINCFYYLNWFINDNDYMYETEIECKIPSYLTGHSILLVLKFLLLQIKTQIKNNPQISHLVDINTNISNVLSFYFMAYKQKLLEHCFYIMTYLILLSKNLTLQTFNNHLDLQNPSIIQQILTINYLYQELNTISVQHGEKTNPKSKSKSKERTNNPLNDPKIQEYLRIINDIDLLVPYSTK